MEREPLAPRSVPSRTKFRLDRFIIPVFFAVIAILILKDHFPAIDEAIERIIDPRTYTARQACHSVALAGAGQPVFARITAPGEVHETQGAFFVEGVTVGEMGQAGGEVTYVFTCYVDRDGKVVKSHKGAPVSSDSTRQSPPRETLSE